LESICSIVRQAESNFKDGTTEKSAYVSFSMKEDLDTIDAYLNSKHISGEEDTLGRLKPFFNIVIAVRNLWFRATDIDRKNIRIKSSKVAHYLMAFLASIHLQNWMRKTNFGKFLNDWGLVLASHGSSVIKFVEKDGMLYPETIPWSQLIVDPVDFEHNPVIEKLYFTPAQLRQNKSYNRDMVEQLIASKGPRKTTSGQQIDQKADYIEVYEIHGELPLYYLTDKEEDEQTYQQQMHAISFVSKRGRNTYDDYTLYSGREKQSPYMLTHLIEEKGQTLSNGAVKYLFQSQWMVNHSAKLIKDQLDLASKIIFQTSDGNFVGKNVLTQIENGDILTHAQNQPLTQLNNKPDIAAMQAFGQQWHSLSKEITSTPEALRGETLPSGTPYSLGAYLGGQAGSLFELMVENKGLYIEEMMRKFILPYLKKKMDTTEEISATLESHQIKQIDSAFVPGEAIKQSNQKIIDDVLSGKITEQPDIMALEGKIQAKLDEKGNQRFISPSLIKTTKWKDVFKDFKGIFECDPTDEKQDTQAVMATYDTALKFIIGLQGRKLTPVEEYLFNGLISQTGYLSPVEISSLNASTPPSQLPIEPAQSVEQPVRSVAGQQLQTAIK